MKSSVALILICMAGLSSCTTLSNRRDMYFPQVVEGPYTRMAKHGIPKTKIVTVTTVKGSGDGKTYAPPR